MKTKKTVTEKVIAANRANAQKTAGPRNTNAVSQNALKHGLLAKHLLFPSAEEDEAEFHTLLDELDDDYKPVSRMERALIEEIAVAYGNCRQRTAGKSRILLTGARHRSDSEGFGREL